MVLPFNMCNVDVAMIGNHDLDYGIFQLKDVIRKTQDHDKYFPGQSHIEKRHCDWVVSNLVIKRESPEDKLYTAGGLKPFYTTMRCGKKIGFVGMIERDWFETFKDLEVEFEYLNYKHHCALLVEKLR
jgi:2',3'-cyclic-nucleotide 2'-phosphodiesterase (5'-nucleotidase family)